MYFEEPEEIIYNFLRARVGELTRTGLADRTASDSQTFVGDASTTEFTFTTQPICVISATVNGVTQIPYEHFNIDLDNKKISFVTAPGNLEDVVVSFKTGTNWIFPDSPRENLTKNSYPRIASIQLGKSSSFEELGGTANTYDDVLFQIDVLGYKDQICTTINDTVTGVDVSKFLARQIENAFKDYTATDLLFVVYNWQILDNSPVPFAEPLNIHRRVISIRVQFRNLRRLIQSQVVSDSYLLLESGDNFLLESGDQLVLE
jgi:hypothetical protein